MLHFVIAEIRGREGRTEGTVSSLKPPRARVYVEDAGFLLTAALQSASEHSLLFQRMGLGVEIWKGLVCVVGKGLWGSGEL